jgi:ADP-ribose pyrophosphatase
MWKTLKSTPVFKNQWVEVINDEIAFADGSPGVYSYMKRHDGAEAVVLTTDNKIILLKQFRYPMHKYDWSIPGGKIDEGESPEAAAKREVEEEVGVTIDRLEKIGVWDAQSSANTERIHIFVGWSKDKPQSLGMNNESVKEIRAVSAEEALKMIDQNEITDPITSAALQSVIRRYL